MQKDQDFHKCRILIVEDELIVRKALRYIIEQESKAFEIIGEVTNGEEALEFLEENLPHVMICDIMMPRMNGLELLRAANLKYPEISAIVLSGYQDFEYVKSAFQYGVVDYILKPELESDHLLKALGQIARKSGAGHALRHENGGVLQETRSPGDSYASYYLIALQPGTTLRGAVKKQELAMGHMEEILKETFGRALLESFILKKQQVYAYVVGSLYFGMFDEKLELMTEQAKTYLRNLEMIISPPYNSRDFLEEEAEKLSQLFSYRFFDSQREYLDLRQAKGEKSLRLDQKAICELVRQHKTETAAGILTNYLDSRKDAMVSQAFVKNTMENIVYNTVFELAENGVCPDKLEGRKMSFLTAIGQADTLDGLKEAVNWIYQEIGRILEEESGDSLYLKITDYLYQHYSEPVTLKSLASAFNMNYSYLSSYFSSHTGQGINEFLNSVRVEKAKELLSASGLSLAEIAQSIGYTDQSYFGKVFKKQTGLSPHSYKKQLKRQEADHEG